MIDLFTATPAEREIIERIAKRAVALYRKYGNTDVDELDIQMDLEACHCNGCPLRLADMEQADNFNFMHDVTGINVHLNHDTGIRSELNRANHGNHLSSDDLVHKLINRAEPVNPIPPVYIYIDQP